MTLPDVPVTGKIDKSKGSVITCHYTALQNCVLFLRSASLRITRNLLTLAALNCTSTLLPDTVKDTSVAGTEGGSEGGSMVGSEGSSEGGSVVGSEGGSVGGAVWM